MQKELLYLLVIQSIAVVLRIYMFFLEDGEIETILFEASIGGLDILKALIATAWVLTFVLRTLLEYSNEKFIPTLEKSTIFSIS